MIHLEDEFQGSGGDQLFCQSWSPQKKARAMLVMVHGVGEHSGRYGHLHKAMLAQGYAIHAFDLRGHGRSSGQRGAIDSWADYRDDLQAFLLHLHRIQPDLPRVLFGHSMGGLIVLEYGLHKPKNLQGLIVSAPPLGEIDLPYHLRLCCRLLDRVWPNLALTSPLDLTAISRDQAEVQAYRDDPLNHALGTPRLAMELIKAARWTLTHAEQLRLPLLLLHGSDDRLASPQGSRSFARQLPVDLRQLYEYPGGFHELHNDLLRDHVFADMTDWLESHIFMN